MKDLFSAHAAAYARYRPVYPAGLFTWLMAQSAATDAAWDCGTGNGQVATVLSSLFTEVSATDISSQQLAQAPVRSNITYSVAPAENSGLPDHHFDLVVVAQAVHWFAFEAFYQEVKRVLKPGGLVALIGYGLMYTDPETDLLVQQLYGQTLGGYWDPERRYLDEGYQTIPFPFEPVQAPTFSMQAHWQAEQLLGYLNTWSAVKQYEKRNGINPVNQLAPQLKAAWKETVRTVSFPLLLRVGRT